MPHANWWQPLWPQLRTTQQNISKNPRFRNCTTMMTCNGKETNKFSHENIVFKLFSHLFAYFRKHLHIVVTLGAISGSQLAAHRIVCRRTHNPPVHICITNNNNNIAGQKAQKVKQGQYMGISMIYFYWQRLCFVLSVPLKICKRK